MCVHMYSVCMSAYIGVGTQVDARGNFQWSRSIIPNLTFKNLFCLSVLNRISIPYLISIAQVSSQKKGWKYQSQK